MVAGFVAYERHGLHVHGGDDELAELPVRQRLARGRDYLRDDVVFPQVHALVRRAGHRPAEAHLPRAVVREEPRAEQPLQLAHHARGAGVAGDERAAEAPRGAHPAEEPQQRHGHADVRLRALCPEHFRLLRQRAAEAEPHGPRAEALHGPADELAQAVRAREGHGDGHPLARGDELAYARGKKADGVRDIPLGVEYPLGRPGRAARRAGDDAAHLGLRGQQQPRRVFRKLLRCGEGKGTQLVETAQPLRQALVEAAARLLAREQLVQAPELNILKRLTVEGRKALDFAYPVFKPCLSHFLYSARPSLAVRL